MTLFRKLQIALFPFTKPKVGERVKVAVGFSSYLNEGIVARICDGYCWIDEYSKNTGKYLRSFTASFSYCIFYYHGVDFK